jgi:SAM-dependent methyltransferase
MNAAVSSILRCPKCSGTLDAASRQEVENCALCCSDCRTEYPIVRGIPRFVPPKHYTETFGFQWNRFAQTQLDSRSGRSVSRHRFFGATGWAPADLREKLVLDVGCGAGRFAEIALNAGAQVVAVDASSAVDACLANLGGRGDITVLQADIYRLPFAPESFDYVYCLGVLQHTPDVERAFYALPVQLKPGAKLAVDVYPRQLRDLVTGKFWLRPITRRMDTDCLFARVEKMVAALWPLSLFVGRLPFGRYLRRLIPISNYEGIYDLTPEQLREWALLDTYDMLASRHDHPQTARTLRRWFERAQLREVKVLKVGHLVGRGRR